MKYKRKTIAIYTILHFLVDFTTVYLVSSVLLGLGTTITSRGYIIILYNLIAFSLQLPIGMIADTVSNKSIFASIGCLLSALSYPASLISPWVSCMLAAVGNGAFHIGAGTQILEISMPRAGSSGLFVSSGALGVYLAYRAGSKIFPIVCPVVMNVFFAYLTTTKNFYKPEEKPLNLIYKNPGTKIFFAIICFMFTIIIRSLLGMAMKYSWQSVPAFSALSIISVVLGKALGGFLADKFTPTKTAAISLCLSALFFVFSFKFALAGILGMLLFNMTMPLTLTAISSVSGAKYGFSFGMTTFALSLGFIPMVFGAGKIFSVNFLLFSVLLSLIFILLGYLLLKGDKKCG